MEEDKNDEKVLVCEHGKSMTKQDWVFLNRNYGEIPSCGCVKCHACDTMIDPDNDSNGSKEVVDDEVGTLTLCKDCPVYVLCDKCDKYVHPDNAQVLGECAGYHFDVCFECNPLSCEMCDTILGGVEGEDYFTYDDNADYLLVFCKPCDWKYNGTVSL